MTGKIRYLAALIAVLGLIYIQQSSVTYAGEGHFGREKVIKESSLTEGQESLQTGEEDKQPAQGEDKPPMEGEGKPPTEGEDKPPIEGGDKSPIEGGDKPSAEEDKPTIEGEDKPPTEGEGKPPVEEEDKPLTEGEDKSPIEEEDEPPAEGENKQPTDGNLPIEGENKQPAGDEEKRKVIEEYKIEIPKPNGEQGYYTKKPEITISHISEIGVTKYCLKYGDSKLGEKTLKKKGEKAIITGNMFLEGKNTLHVWMEDKEGKKLEKYELKKELLIDTKEPEIQMNVPKGFNAWYQGEVMLSIAGEDSGSGLAKLSCREGNRNLGSISKRQGEFVLSRSSISGKGVDVTVTAEDKAGNKSERVKTVFIDKADPEVIITGAKNYMITSKSVNLVYEISEENMLQEFYAQTVWTNIKGKEKQLSSSEWKNHSKGKILTQTLKNDGIYRVKVQAKDMSGHVSIKDMQVIVDKTDPIIRYIEELNGQQLKKFKWEYPLNQMIQDFTTYAYEMRIDGRLYHMGETVSAEGKHRMTVKVTDAAGNTAHAAADFIVDHTAPEIIFRNVEEGKEYEEERTFHVELAKKDDIIRQIKINGESQRIDSKRASYKFTLHKSNDYEVVVKADDKAGNESVKSIFFKLMPKKSLVERITEPIKIQWNIGQKADMQFPKTVGEGEWKNDNNLSRLKVIGIIMIGGILLVLRVVYYKMVYMKKKHDWKAAKREDAG